MEHWWDDADENKSNYRDKNLSYCHAVHTKSHMNWPMIRFEPTWWKAGDGV
jgi:hypothetical protein